MNYGLPLPGLFLLWAHERVSRGLNSDLWP
jgi:hypothetical protein